MPRKRVLLTDPSNAMELNSYIEDHASRPSSNAFLALVRASFPLAQLNFATWERSQVQHYDSRTKSRRGVHIRGQIAESPCNNCRMETVRSRTVSCFKTM